MNPTWIIMPILAGLEMTVAAIADSLAQSVPVRLLLINQGAPDDLRRELERVAEAYPEQVFVWSHEPPLPSLSATWNRALEFVWECGGQEALVLNNDTRIHRQTVQTLSTVLASTAALFVSAVGVKAEQFNPGLTDGEIWEGITAPVLNNVGIIPSKGGPDFSCFLISKACHLEYPFDEQFVPAFCEDLDLHRRLMLAGEGHRIFSINLPFLHLSSQTLKQVDPAKKAAIERQIEGGARAHYFRKWGGAPNQEAFWTPFRADRKLEEVQQRSWQAGGVGPTTPELQAYYQRPQEMPPEPPANSLDEDIPF